MGSSKRNSITFNDIIGNGNIVGNIYDITESSSHMTAPKERHASLAIKVLSDQIVDDNLDDVDIDNSSFTTSEDEVLSHSEIGDNYVEKIETNNLKKYQYTCITFFESNITNNQQMKLAKLKQTLRDEEAREIRINSLKYNNSCLIFEIRRKLFNLNTKLKAICQQLANDTNIIMSNIEEHINKKWEYIRIKDEIETEEKARQELLKKQKTLCEYINKNKKIRNVLKNNIDILKTKINKKIFNKKFIKKIAASKSLETKINNTLTLNDQQLIKLMKKQLKLEKEIATLKQKNNQTIIKAYEEINLQEKYLYFITTLVHHDQSMTEEVKYIENDQDGVPIVWTQIKKYQNIEQYKNDQSIVVEISDDNINNFSRLTIKKFLLNLEAEKNKISNSEWILYTSFTILSIMLLAVTPATAPFILSIAWEKVLVSVIGISIGWFVNKGIGALIIDKTKKVEALVKKKVFSLMRKIFKKRSIGKIKEEMDIKKDIDKLTDNLKSERLEIRLLAQFSILKSLLNVRKDMPVNQLIDEKEILKVKSVITAAVDNNFDANQVNNFNIHPTTSVESRKRHYSF